jgi:hypothetical protein
MCRSICVFRRGALEPARFVEPLADVFIAKSRTSKIGEEGRSDYTWCSYG